LAASSLRLKLMTTSYPLFANATAVLRPIPVEAPVTSATGLSRLMIEPFSAFYFGD
jgi:hypothetical protein